MQNGRAVVLVAAAAIGCGDAPKSQVSDEAPPAMNDAEALYKEGTELLNSDPYGAIELFTQSLDAQPDAPPALYNRAIAYSRVGRDREAVADVERLSKIDPEAGKELQARFLVAAAPYSDLGNREIEAGNYQAAITKFDAALLYDPQYANAWVGKGIALVELEKQDGALECYNRAVEVEPDNFYAFYNRGELHHKQARLDAALADYTRAIELSPDESFVYDERARVYSDLNQPQKAAADRMKADELRPDEPSTNEDVP